MLANKKVLNNLQRSEYSRNVNLKDKFGKAWRSILIKIIMIKSFSTVLGYNSTIFRFRAIVSIKSTSTSNGRLYKVEITTVLQTIWRHSIIVRNRPQQDASNDHVRRTVMRSVLTCDSLRLVIRHVQRCINYLLIKYAWCINITTASQTIFIFVAHTHVLGSQGSRFDGVRP